MAKVTTLVSRDGEFDCDIGRPSIWGNPYSHVSSAVPGTIRVETREEALKKYVAWLEENPSMIDMMKKFLKGKRLACHCRLEEGTITCHGQIIVAILEEVDPRSVK
jgi:hypothetical protein